MDTIALSSTSTCDLNTKFNHRCHADWSNDDLISIVSSDGIYILKPQPEHRNGPFDIQFVRNPTVKFSHSPPADNLGPTFDKRWSALDKHQYMQVFMDSSLATHISNLSLERYPRRFRMAKWSPVIEIFPKDCILATLTTDYQLLIVAKKNSAWIVVSDLSSEYDALWKRSFSLDDNPEGSFESIKNKLHSLSFCNICWYEPEKGYVFLLAATILGDIIVWRLTSSNNHWNLTFQTILRTRLKFITSLQVVDELLILSAQGGQVLLYEMETHLSGPERLIDPVIFDPIATLWPEDNIEVMDLYAQRTRDSSLRVLISKSTNICWCIVDKQALSSNQSFSAIDVSSPATWIRSAGDRRAVAIADDGSFFQLEFVNDLPDTSPIIIPIHTGRIDLTRMVPRGLCTSAQGNLITIISAISLAYEPDKISASTKVTMLATHNDERFLTDCFDKFSDEAWLADQNIQSTMDVYDRIEYVRTILGMLPFARFLELNRNLKEALISIGCPQNSTEVVRFKILAFILLKLSSQSGYQSISQSERIDFGRDVFSNLLKYYIREVLSTISNDLNPHQVNSLRNYLSWLKTVPHGNVMIESFSEKFKELESKYTSVIGEQCIICLGPISFEEPELGICASGHRFARCARSLLIVEGDKVSCEHCQRHYLLDLVWPAPAHFWPCLFCQ